MSALDEALRHLGSGEPAVLTDEDRSGVGFLVAPADGADAALLHLMQREGERAPTLWSDTTMMGSLRSFDSKPAAVASALAADFPRQAAAALKALFSRDNGSAPADLDRLGLARGAVEPHGVLANASEAEAAVDAVRLAGRLPAALVTSLKLTGGVLAADDAASDWSVRHGMPIFSIQDVLAARLASETTVDRVASARLPSLFTDVPLEVQAYRSRVDGVEHLALVHGPLGPDPLVRLHSECLTGDALGSLRCDCGDQLRASLRLIGEHASGGVVVYLRGQEGRGIGLANKIRAYALQDLGRDTVEANLDLGFPADLRSYAVAVQILRELGVGSVKLLTNNPEKSRSLGRYGIRVTEQVALRIEPNPHSAAYLDTKRRKLGHDFAPSS